MRFGGTTNSFKYMKKLPVIRHIRALTYATYAVAKLKFDQLRGIEVYFFHPDDEEYVNKVWRGEA